LHFTHGSGNIISDLKMVKIETWLIIGVCLLSLINMGVIRKKENPITATQTSPIAYKDKVEELKDGEKGAPLPSMLLYSKWEFFTDAPYEKSKDEEGSLEESWIPRLGEPIPEDLEGGEEALSLEDWWKKDDDEKSESDY